MAIVTLRAYLDELTELYNQQALEEVVAHARFILQTFPKNVAVYRILGQTLLRRDDQQEALDVFQRVLSAAPDDAQAHRALAALYQDQEAIPQAIWHLERAFEIDANDTATRDFLRRLYEKQTGAVPDRLNLTRGGLAYLHFRGQLFDQAIAELQALLAAEPDRVDLRLLLTRTLWAYQRPTAAADLALQVLEALPDALDANEIMARLWLQYKRPTDARPFLDRLQALDPYRALKLLRPNDPTAEQSIQLPHLEYGNYGSNAILNETPEWMSGLGDQYQYQAEGNTAGSDPFGLSNFPAAGRDWNAGFAAPNEGAAQSIDWFAQPDTSGSGSPGYSDEGQYPSSAANFSPSEQPFGQEAGNFSSGAAAPVPDWFTQLDLPGTSATSNPPSPMQNTAPIAPAPSFNPEVEFGLPDYLTGFNADSSTNEYGFGDNSTSTPAASNAPNAAPSADEFGLPDYLLDFNDGAPPEPDFNFGSSPAGRSGSAGASPFDDPSLAPLPDEALPDWFQSVSTPAAAGTAAPSNSAPAPAVSDWNAPFPDFSAAPPTSAPSAIPPVEPAAPLSAAARPTTPEPDPFEGLWNAPANSSSSRESDSSTPLPTPTMADFSPTAIPADGAAPIEAAPADDPMPNWFTEVPESAKVPADTATPDSGDIGTPSFGDSPDFNFVTASSPVPEPATMPDWLAKLDVPDFPAGADPSDTLIYPPSVRDPNDTQASRRRFDGIETVPMAQVPTPTPEINLDMPDWLSNLPDSAMPPAAPPAEIGPRSSAHPQSLSAIPRGVPADIGPRSEAHPQALRSLDALDHAGFDSPTDQGSVMDSGAGTPDWLADFAPDRSFASANAPVSDAYNQAFGGNTDPFADSTPDIDPDAPPAWLQELTTDELTAGSPSTQAATPNANSDSAAPELDWLSALGDESNPAEGIAEEGQTADSAANDPSGTTGLSARLNRLQDNSPTLRVRPDFPTRLIQRASPDQAMADQAASEPSVPPEDLESADSEFFEPSAAAPEPSAPLSAEVTADPIASDDWLGSLRATADDDPFTSPATDHAPVIDNMSAFPEPTFEELAAPIPPMASASVPNADTIESPAVPQITEPEPDYLTRISTGALGTQPEPTDTLVPAPTPSDDWLSTLGAPAEATSNAQPDAHEDDWLVQFGLIDDSPASATIPPISAPSESAPVPQPLTPPTPEPTTPPRPAGLTGYLNAADLIPRDPLEAPADSAAPVGTPLADSEVPDWMAAFTGGPLPEPEPAAPELESRLPEPDSPRSARPSDSPAWLQDLDFSSDESGAESVLPDTSADESTITPDDPFFPNTTSADPATSLGLDQAIADTGTDWLSAFNPLSLDADKPTKSAFEFKKPPAWRRKSTPSDSNPPTSGS